MVLPVVVGVFVSMGGWLIARSCLLFPPRATSPPSSCSSIILSYLFSSSSPTLSLLPRLS